MIARAEAFTEDPHEAIAPPSWSVEQYHAMIGSGILPSGENVELLEGEIVRKMTLNPPHRIAVKKLRRAIEKLLPEEWECDSQVPLTTFTSEPEPDGIVYRSELDQQHVRHPRPEEVALVVEVADSSLDEDHGRKLRIYSAAGIPTYWIVNLLERKVEVREAPGQQEGRATYVQRQDFGEDQAVPLVLRGQSIGQIAVRDLLP